MRMGSFAGGLMSGIMSGMKARDWMDEKAGKEELKQLQAEQFNKVDNEGAVLAAKDADGNAYYEKVGDNQYRLRGAAAEGEGTGLRDNFKLTSERDAANNYLQAAQARGLMQPMEAMKHRNAASQNELTSLQLGEAKRKASIFDGLSQIADEESAALNKRPDAVKAAEAEIAGLENPTEQIKQEIRLKHTGGLLPDDKVRFDFGLKRSRALERAGMFDEARKIHDESVSRAAVGFNRALMSGDYATAAQLYNIYPNGHQIKDIRPGSENGHLVITDSEGKSTPITMHDLVVSATELVKPGTAASAMMSEKKYQEALAKLMAGESYKNDRKFAEIAARIEKMNGGGGRGSSGSGSGKSGAISSDIDSPEDFKKGMFWGEGNTPEYASDAYTWLTMLQSAAGPSRLENPRDRQYLRKTAADIAAGKVVPRAEFDPASASWKYMVKDVHGNTINVQNNDIDPYKMKLKPGSNDPLYDHEALKATEKKFVDSILSNGYLGAKPEHVKAFISDSEAMKNLILLASGKVPDGRGGLVDVSSTMPRDVAEANSMLRAVNLAKRYVPSVDRKTETKPEEVDMKPLAFKIGDAFSKVGQVLNPFRTGQIEENRRKSREGLNEWGTERNW